MREPDRERAEPRTRDPPAGPDKLVERLVQRGRVDGSVEQVAPVPVKPDDRLRPGSRVIGVKAGLPPQETPALIGESPRECLRKVDESVADEALDFPCCQHARDSARRTLPGQLNSGRGRLSYPRAEYLFKQAAAAHDPHKQGWTLHQLHQLFPGHRRRRPRSTAQDSLTKPESRHITASQRCVRWIFRDCYRDPNQDASTVTVSSQSSHRKFTEPHVLLTRTVDLSQAARLLQPIAPNRACLVCPYETPRA